MSQSNNAYRWVIRTWCCGYVDKPIYTKTWEEADRIRDRLYEANATSTHQRAGIIEALLASAEDR